jgi:sulfite exporter TauE/SafE
LYGEQQMNWNSFRISAYFAIAGIITGFICWFALPAGFQWFASIIATVIILLGICINTLVLAYRTERKIEALAASLKHIGQLQESIKNEQEKQASAHTPVVATLQALSQLYMDSLSGQQSGEEEQSETGDTD